MQENREKKMDKKEAKKPLTKIVSMAQLNIQMVAMDILVYFLCLFYFPLKCDPLEKTSRKAEGYAYKDVVRRLLKWDSIFKATYSLP